MAISGTAISASDADPGIASLTRATWFLEGGCPAPPRPLYSALRGATPRRAPFVYRLGLKIFNLARRVRLP